MLNIITEIANRIENRWRDIDYSCYGFADIAKDEMLRADLVNAFEFKLLNQFINRSEIKAIQIASEFSELHMKLFDNGKFYIEVLNWWDKDTSIHDHGFSGVLLQLEGSALNALYTFEEDATVSHSLRLGSIKLKDIQISNKGDYRVIPCGRDECHAVLHLEQPTISLIIRTHPVVELSPQLNYFPPHLLVDHSAIDIAFGKRIKYFKLLGMMQGSSFRDELLLTMNSSSHTENFWLLMKLSGLIFSPGNIAIVRDFIETANSSSDKVVREKLIQSTYARKCSQFIIDQVKPRFSDRPTRLLLAGLAASYSAADYNLAFDKIGMSVTEKSISSIVKTLPKAMASEFLMSLNALSENKV